MSAQQFDLARTGLAAPMLEEVEQATRAHLEQAQSLISAQQWSEAVETLRRVMETDGERLIAVPDAADAPFARYVPVRQYGQSILARWATSAPEALRRYRSELDPLAEQWLQQARSTHDQSLLLDIVQQLFTTSSGDEALLTLGEYALERGEYHLARGYFERISPALRTPQLANTVAGRPLWQAVPTNDDEQQWQALSAALQNAPVSSGWLAYPDTNLALADIRARLVLVSVMEGSVPRAQRELELLQRLHPDAIGKIGGISGKYADLLAKLIVDARQWAGPAPSENWPTFAGNESRSVVAPKPIDVGGDALWRVPLPPVSSHLDVLSRERLRVAEHDRWLLSYFPVVVDGSVFVSLGDRIHTFDLQTGKSLLRTSSRTTANGAVIPGLLYEMHSVRRLAFESPQFGVPRFTLSADSKRLFARVGSQITRLAIVPAAIDENDGFLVGLDLAAEGRLLPGFPLKTEDASWSFEGTPFSRGRHLYVGLKRQDEVRVESYVACYDALTGQQLWRRLVCAAETPGQGRWNELTHNLLTWHEGVLFYNTNLGVLAAISAADGQLNWLVRYPRSPGSEQTDHLGESHFFRSLNPALAYRDIIVCAPADSNRIFAVDAFAGQLLWSTAEGAAADVVHLLGVGQDHLLASGESLYWFHIYDGQMRGQFPGPFRDAIGHARPRVRGYGRGVLAADAVYWPTKEAIYVFQQRPVLLDWGWSPLATRAPIDLTVHKVYGGNLTVAGEVLLIAGVDELVALDPFGKQAEAPSK